MISNMHDSLLQETTDHLVKLQSAYKQQKNDETRKKLIATANRLSLGLLSHGEIVDRYMYRTLDFILLKVAHDLDILSILCKRGSPVSTSELASISGADETLIGRLMRGLASFYAVAESGDDGNLWAPTETTKAFVTLKGSFGLDCFHDWVHPTWASTPGFLQRTGYASPGAGLSPFNDAFNTQDHAFIWITKQQQILESFNKYLIDQRDGHMYWLDSFSLSPILEGFDRSISDVMLVDVGGAKGQEIEEIQRRHPGLPGRMILQDIPDTIATVSEVNFEPTVHDFFTAQPVIGARLYYFRNILHDWPDDACNIILSHTVKAMVKGYSKVIINELVVPNQGAGWFATRSDWMMMAMHSAIERTQSQWDTMLEKAGLKIESIWRGDSNGEAIIIAALPE